MQPPDSEEKEAGSGCDPNDRACNDRTWLQQRGELLIGSGVLHSGRAGVAVHTDLGPLGQEKAHNEDYALVWSGNGQAEIGPCGAIAIADGLTSSYRSELGAEIACCVGLRTLVSEMNPGSPRQSFAAAVEAALVAIKAVSAQLGREPRSSCPPDEFLSTWNYILREGKLLETTLTLAWLESGRLHASMIGDGGLVWRTYDPPCSEVLAQCNLATHKVNALGPAVTSPVPLDHYSESHFNQPFLCALFTDGVGRGIGADPQRLLDELDAIALHRAANPARDYIETAIVERAQAFDDNLTLAVIRDPWTAAQ